MRATSATLISDARQDAGANLDPDFAGSEESLRRLILCNLPYGSEARLSADTHQRPEQVSKQLNGENALRCQTLMASRRYVPVQVWAAISAILNGAGPAFESRQALVIRIDGQLYLPGMA